MNARTTTTVSPQGSSARGALMALGASVAVGIVAGCAPTDDGSLTYSTEAFSVPLTMDIAPVLVGDEIADTPGMLTWQPTPTEDGPDVTDVAVRFFAPAVIYRPGSMTPETLPEDYEAYFETLQDHGVVFADERTIDVAGETIVVRTVTTESGLDGAFGCAVDPVEDCYGPQPDFALPLAVIDRGDDVLLAWLRLPAAGYDPDVIEPFLRTLESIRLDERAAAPTGVPEARPGYAECVTIQGARCIDLLDPGQHTTSQFAPAFTFSVPEGWILAHDLRSEFLVHRVSDPQSDPLRGGNYLAIFPNAAIAAADCEAVPDAGWGRSSADFAEWARTHPGIEASDPEEIAVGGLSGVSIDLRLEDDWTGSCPFLDGIPTVPLFVAGSVHHGLVENTSMRLIVLESEDGTLVVEVNSLDDQLTALEYREVTQPLLDSIRFTR